jgi:hypothetical protein
MAAHKRKPTPKVPRKKKLRLTAVELRLLEFPPSEGTWQCQQEQCNKAFNNGKSDWCWICGTPQGKKPVLAFPIYEGACKKVGIEPGVMWKIQDRLADRVAYRVPKGSWRAMEVPEGFTL